MKRFLLATALILAAAAVAAWELGLLPRVSTAGAVASAEAPSKARTETPPPAVSVVAPSLRRLEARVLVTGTLVARSDVLIAPEVDGLRVVDLQADIGDRVSEGQVLARLERETLELQLSQRDASVARARAAIAQSRSAIAQAEARREEASNARERGQSLKNSGFLSESTLDQREAAARTAQAALVSARDGLALAEAEFAQADAQRRDTLWRLGKTELRSPAAGVVSHRNARVGGVAAGAGEPMFRVIRDGEVELDAEIPEAEMARLAAGQSAAIEVSGIGRVEGRVRLVSPEVDRMTRLGRVRIALGDNPNLRIGSFGRGSVVTAQRDGLAVPTAAVQFTSGGASVLVVDGDSVVRRQVKSGLKAGEWIEIREGLSSADRVVAKAGTFLREGDRVNPVASSHASGVN